MTPRIIDQVFSQFILEQSKSNGISLNFTAETSPLSYLHPRMIRAMLEFMDDPQKLPERPLLPNLAYACYSVADEGLREFPGANVLKALPCNMARFLSGQEEQVLFDLGQLGAFLLSRSPLTSEGTSGLHSHLLPPFISYATSNELWGSQGKWSRFHERLHTHFVKNNLLNGPDLPGFYPLIKEAQKLEARGVTGTISGNSYTLTMPWTFSLSSLDELEKILIQEF